MPSASVIDSRMLPFRDTTGLYGYMDVSGEVVIAPCYGFAQEFSDGVGRVLFSPGMQGFVDGSGAPLFDQKFDEAGDFSDGYAVVYDRDSCGIIDKAGRVVIPFEFEDLGGFYDGVTIAQRNGKFGLIDRDARVVSDFLYDEMDGFDSEGWCRVRRGGDIWYILADGRTALSVPGQLTETFYGDYAILRDCSGVGYVDRSGELRTALYRDAQPYSEGYFGVCHSEGWCFLDIDESPIGADAAFYEEIVPFHHSRAAVCVRGLWGLIDTSGRSIMPCNYEHIGPVFENFTVRISRGNEWIYLDSAGRRITARP